MSLATPTVGRIVHVYDQARGPVPGIVVEEGGWSPLIRALSPKGPLDDLHARIPYSEKHEAGAGIHWCWPPRVST